MVDWPAEVLIRLQLGRNLLMGRSAILWVAIFILDQWPLWHRAVWHCSIRCCVPISRTHRSGNHSSSWFPETPCRIWIFHSPKLKLCSSLWKEILLPECPARVPLNLMLPVDRFRLLRPMDRQTKLEVTTLMGWVCPVFYKDLGSALYNGDKEESIWHQGYLLRAPWCLLAMSQKCIRKYSNHALSKKKITSLKLLE